MKSLCEQGGFHEQDVYRAAYESFPPEQARDSVQGIDFVYTPRHGSWLNEAECALIGDLDTLQTEIAAWSTRVNGKQQAVDWEFTIDKARGKLKRLYSKI